MTGAELDVGARLAMIAERLDTATRRACRRIVAEAAANVTTVAKKTVPVYTGVLRDSITPTQDENADGMAWEVGTNIEYAVPVEYGTKRMAARPYIRPALENERAKIGDHAREVFAEEYAKERRPL